VDRSWLVIEVVQDKPTMLGGPLVLFGVAHRLDDDMLRVTTPQGQATTAVIGGMPAKPLAAMMLRELLTQP